MTTRRLGLAYTRVQIKDKLEEFLDGALYQHYLLTLLAQTTQTYLFDHWMDKKQARLRGVISVLTHASTVGTTAKLTVCHEVEQMLSGRSDEKTQAAAWKHFGAVYASRVDMTKLVITAEDTAAFWIEVYDSVAAALES